VLLCCRGPPPLLLLLLLLLLAFWASSPALPTWDWMKAEARMEAKR
jgi:hypothetical protein